MMMMKKRMHPPASFQQESKDLFPSLPFYSSLLPLEEDTERYPRREWRTSRGRWAPSHATLINTILPSLPQSVGGAKEQGGKKAVHGSWSFPCFFLFFFHSFAVMHVSCVMNPTCPHPSPHVAEDFFHFLLFSGQAMPREQNALEQGRAFLCSLFFFQS